MRIVVDGETAEPSRETILFARLLDRVLVTLALIALAFLLTVATERATSDHTSVFYLSAAVLCTWALGLGCGIVVVIAGSLLTMREPFAPMDTWQFSEGGAWIRVLIYASLAAAFAVLIDRLRSRTELLGKTVTKLQTVFELAPVGIAIVDHADVSRSAAHVNAALADMLGARDRDLVLEPDQDGRTVFSSDGRTVPPHQLPLHVAVASGRTSEWTHLEVARNHRSVHVLAQAAPLLDDHAPYGVVGAYVDVTDATRREEQLQRAIHAKDEFLGMISHELKTPLTVIAGNAEILERLGAGSDERIEGALRDVRSSSEYLLHSVDNLLALSRVGDRALDLEPVNVCRIIEQVAEEHRSTGYELRLNCRDGMALAVPYAVEQVLGNLLANAEKYSPPGTPIELEAIREYGEVRIVVRDRGFGLLEEELESVFDPFYRSPRTSATTGGMGIGLSVCKRMVAAMRGRMWAVQRDGGGSEFGFSLLSARTERDENGRLPSSQ